MSDSIKIISDIKLSCGEGPVWVPATQDIIWTDSDGDTIYKFSFSNSRTSQISTGIRAASLAQHEDGGLVIVNDTGFHHLDADHGLSPIAMHCEGQPMTMINDVIADSQGRIYGGQESFTPDQEYKPGFLYRVDLDGLPSIIEEGLHLANGMGFSPDNRTFYLVDTIPRIIYAYDFNISDGSISNKRTLIQLDQNDGLPDGLTVDAEGYIWVARFLGGGISRFDPDGKLERKLQLPIAQPTSLTFGGKNYNELFITSASMYWETPLAPTDHNYKLPRGGELIWIKTNVKGLAQNSCKIPINKTKN